MSQIASFYLVKNGQKKERNFRRGLFGRCVYGDLGLL